MFLWFQCFKPLDTGRKLNVYKTFKRRPERFLNVLRVKFTSYFQRAIFFTAVTSRLYSLIQSQKWKQQQKLQNLLKVNNKHTKA